MELKNLEKKLDNLTEKLSQMETIHITNGGGRHIMFKRQEFYQMIYDKTIFRWKDYAKDLVIILSVLTNIALFLKAFGLIK